MAFDWDNFWVTICLGIVAITSAAVGTAFFSANLADLATSAVDIENFAWVWWRLMGVLFVAGIYVTQIRHAEEAMFATEIELARRGTHRRQAVRHVFHGLLLVIVGLLLVVAANATEDLVAALNANPMMPARAD